MVPAGRGDLYRQAPKCLTPDISEVRGRRNLRGRGRFGRQLGPAVFASQHADDAPKARRGPNETTPGERRLSGAGCGDNDEPVRDSVNQWQDPRHLADAPVQPQLSEERHI
jgi:hypothetical protein